MDVVEALRRYHKVNAIDRQRYYFSDINPLPSILRNKVIVRKEILFGKPIDSVVNWKHFNIHI